jgi:hypothetical protein
MFVDFLQPFSAGTFKLLSSVVNLWHDEVGAAAEFRSQLVARSSADSNAVRCWYYFG